MEQQALERGIVWIIDSHPERIGSLAPVLQAAGLRAESHASPEGFLRAFAPPATAGCVLTELQFADGDALDLLGRMRAHEAGVPVIVHTLWGTVPAAVRAFHAGAADFLLAPAPAGELLAAVEEALRIDRESRARARERAGAAARVGALSPRERDVAAHVMEGKTSRVIAAELGISTKTVEAHRGRLMHKVGVTSVPELMSVFGQASA